MNFHEGHLSTIAGTGGDVANEIPALANMEFLKGTSNVFRFSFVVQVQKPEKPGQRGYDDFPKKSYLVSLLSLHMGPYHQGDQQLYIERDVD